MADSKWHSFQDIPFPKLLHMISLRGDEASILEVARGMLKRRIYFKKGRPVHVISNSMSDVLGRIMLENGIISKEAYGKSLEIALKEKKRHGEVLTAMGLISQKELAECLELQMKKKIWKIFGWTDGSYKYFLAKGGLPENLSLLPMNPASLIIGGILNGYYPFEHIETELKKFLDMPLVASSDSLQKIEELGLNTQQGSFLAGFDGASKAKDVIGNSYLLRREADLLLYALVITGILSPKDKFVEQREAPEEALRQEAVEEYSEKGAKEETYSGTHKLDAELIFQGAKTFLAHKDYGKAVTAFEKMVTFNPDEAEYKAYLGWALFNKDARNIKRAKELLLESLTINPDMDTAHLFLARLYMKEGMLEEAEGGLATALKKNPFLPEARKELALIKILSASPVRRKGYLDYFHFTQNPFDPLPDPDFVYPGDAHSEALHFLINNIRNGKSRIIVLAGENGSGKTTLCLKTMERMAAEKIAFVYLDEPFQSELELFIAIKNQLYIKTTTDFSEDVLSALYVHSSTCRQTNGRTVVILDNADKLNTAAMVAIKSLLNSGIDAVVISGRSDMERTLNEHHLREIKQNISATHHLHPLSLKDMEGYVLKRLALAGNEEELKITPWALKIIHNLSLGNPAAINRICDLSLELANKNKTNILDEQIVQAVENVITGEQDEILPQLEPIEEKAETVVEERIKQIVDEQIAKGIEDAVKKEFAKLADRFDSAQIVNEASAKASKLIEEKFKTVIDEQIPTIIEDALKRKTEEKAADISAVAASHEEIEKSEKPAEEITYPIAVEPAPEQYDYAVSKEPYAAEKPPMEHEFVTFEAAETKRKRSKRFGSFFKILIFVLASGVIAGVIANYDISKLGIFSIFSAQESNPPLQTEPPHVSAPEKTIAEKAPEKTSEPETSETILPKPTEEPTPLTAVTTAGELNVREKPGKTFNTTAKLPKNTLLVALGRNADGSWLKIKIPGKTDPGWVSSEFVKIQGDINSLPIAE